MNIIVVIVDQAIPPDPLEITSQHLEPLQTRTPQPAAQTWWPEGKDDRRARRRQGRRARAQARNEE